MDDNQIRQIFRERCDHHGAISHIARQCGVSRAYLSMLISGKIAPGPAVLKYLGLRRVVSYEPAATTADDERKG